MHQWHTINIKRANTKDDLSGLITNMNKEKEDFPNQYTEMLINKIDPWITGQQATRYQLIENLSGTRPDIQHMAKDHIINENITRLIHRVITTLETNNLLIITKMTSLARYVIDVFTTPANVTNTSVTPKNQQTQQ